MFSVANTWDDELALTKIRAIQGRAANLAPFFLGRISPDITSLLEQQFASEGRRMWRGAHWAALNPETVKRKGHDSILIDSMQMFEALTNPAATDGYERVTDQTYQRGATGFAAQKVAWNSDGNAARGIPARPVFGNGIPAPVQRAWAEQMAEYMATGIVPPASSEV